MLAVKKQDMKGFLFLYKLWLRDIFRLKSYAETTRKHMIGEYLNFPAELNYEL